MQWKASIIFLSLLATIAQLAYCQPFICEGNKYLSIRDGGFSKMYEVEIDPLQSTNVSFIPLAAPNTGVNLNAIGYRSTDNFIYGLDIFNFDLIRIDATGNGTRLGPIQGLPLQYGYYGADCTPDGKYLVLIGLDVSSKVLAYVDLENFNAPVQITNLNSSQAFVSTDIAFNPLDGLLYGFDAQSNRIISIDPETGNVDLSSFPTTNICDAMGAVFFDSFGNFFGYGDDLGSNEARSLFKANLIDGIVEKKATGPSASGKDACSCPYTVGLQKEVFPGMAFPCTIVEYIFTLANVTDQVQTDIELLDVLPEGLTFVSASHPDIDATIVSQPGDDFFQMTNMIIPPGLHTITVEVYIEENVEGVLANQAILMGLPDALGGEKVSDDPSTSIEFDSTRLTVNPLFVDFQFDTIVICDDDLVLEATTHGAEYLWQDGSTDPTLSVTEPGIYEVTVTTDCDMAVDNVVVLEQEFLLVPSVPMTIALGDSITLTPIVIGNADYTVQWADPLINSLSCTTCTSTIATPTSNVTYPFEVIPSGSNCTLNGEMKILVEKNRDLYIPNVFSPDGNGSNDHWKIFGGQPFRIVSLGIFSRWGEQVYEFDSGNYELSYKLWDGKLKGKNMQSAVFAWKATFEFLDGFQLEKSGDLTIMK